MRLIRPRGVLLDLDGTLWDEERPIPGVPDAVGRLRAAGLGVRFCTNITRMPRRVLAERLGDVGVAAAVDEVISAPAAAATWLRSEGVQRVALCLPETTFEDFGGFAIVDDRPEAVVVGDLGAGWTFDRLNQAFRWVLSGARLVAVPKGRYWKTAGGLTLDAGAFVAALEYATGVPATLTGKPSSTFFVAAARSLDLAPASVLMVGDDALSDVAGARAAGCGAALVRTGKYRAGDETQGPHPPDLVLDSAADLPAALGIAG
jgi:phospholysine phosphohistidine inorganic pyrophosphate phosphatase